MTMTKPYIYILQATASEKYEPNDVRQWFFSTEEEAREFYVFFKKDIMSDLVRRSKDRFRVIVQKVLLNPPTSRTQEEWFKPIEIENIEQRGS